LIALQATSAGISYSKRTLAGCIVLVPRMTTADRAGINSPAINNNGCATLIENTKIGRFKKKINYISTYKNIYLYPIYPTIYLTQKKLKSKQEASFSSLKQNFLL
jgi:hypothetical protein